MKFLTPALLLIGASASLASEYDGHALVGRKLQDMGEGKKGDMEGGKKGDMNGGKKGDVDCTDGAEPIIACATVISGPGRYVLDGNLSCGPNENGITIAADDVHVDCQDNGIEGNGQNIGIEIVGAIGQGRQVTVSNCRVSNFEIGLVASSSNTRFDDLVVRDSTFNNNALFGMSLEGGRFFPSIFNVIDSTFNGNGNVNGAGIELRRIVGGVIASSTINENIGNGLIARGNAEGEITLVNVIANGNDSVGINAGNLNTVLQITVINSVACGNTIRDLRNPHIAQATTCDESAPEDICQCPC
jgi:hypothetical protein